MIGFPRKRLPLRERFFTARGERRNVSQTKSSDTESKESDHPMPLLHISLRAGKPNDYRQAIFDSLYRAMRETLNVPDDDQFMTITEHDAANFRYGSAFGIARSSDLVYIQITVFNTRTAEQKSALFRRIAELLAENPGIRPEDIFVNILESAKENWSVGNGLAQFS
jgi:phenylpyruvate tautomerase PptA (4-oxalocrotonate tautomerase family)